MSWIKKGNLKAASQGPQGPRGSKFFIGVGPPDEAALIAQGAITGDWWLDISTGQISEFSYTPPVSMPMRYSNNIGAPVSGKKFAVNRFGAHSEFTTNYQGIAPVLVYYSDYREV